jgi:hypothetical protein
MTVNIMDTLFEKIDVATDIVLVSVLAENCEYQEPHFFPKLHELLQLHPTIEFYTLCFTEDEMPFPRLQTQIIYYFLPKTRHPLFFRSISESIAQFDIQIQLARDVLRTGNIEEAVYRDDVESVKTMLTNIETENLATFPSAFQQARNIAIEGWKTGKRLLRKAPIIVPAQVAFDRFSICQQCPSLVNDRCKECGCFMQAKTHVASSSCPLKKWDEYKAI